MVIQGTVTSALQEYSPPSSCSTGEKVRERVVVVPVVSTVPTVNLPPVSTCDPLGWYQVTSGAMFIPDMASTLQTRVWLWLWSAALLGEVVILTEAQLSGTAWKCNNRIILILEFLS